MKKAITLLAAISFLFVGCIDYSSTVKLNPDGSGTIEETVLVSSAFMQMMNSFAQSFSGDSSEAETGFDIFDVEELKQQAAEMGDGVKYLRGEKLKDGNREGYKAFYSFEDIKKITLNDSPNDKIPGDEMTGGTEIDDESYITFNFSDGTPSTLEVIFPEGELEINNQPEDKTDSEEESFNDEAMTQQMKIFLKDFRISMDLEINGEILETNATHVNDNIITFFKMDFGELLNFPEKLDELQKTQPQNITEAKELIKDIPGFKIELNDKIFVKFD